MLSCNEGCPSDGGPMASKQGNRAHDQPRCGGHSEGERASSAYDILNDYKHRRDHTQNNHSPPARHEIGEP